jgi:tetratricopeptide (TPR) repeat protein
LQIATGTQKVDVYIQISEYYRTTDYQQSKEYGEQALHLANELEYQEGQAGAYTQLGMSANKQAQYDEAVTWAGKALVLYQALDNSTEMATNLNTLGISYRNQAKYSEAIESYQQSLKLSEATDEYDPDTVIQEIVTGYRLGDKLIRPALVKVATRK